MKDSIQRWDRAARYKTKPSEIVAEAGLTADDAEALDGAITDLTWRLQENPDGETEPTAQGRIEALLGWLSERVAWPAHLAHDQQAVLRQASILAEELTDQPLEAITRAVKAYPKRNRFWPSAVADLYTAVEAERERMTELRAKLRVMKRAAEFDQRMAAQARRRQPTGETIPESEWARARPKPQKTQEAPADRGAAQAQGQGTQEADTTPHEPVEVPDGIRAALPGRPWAGEQAE